MSGTPDLNLLLVFEALGRLRRQFGDPLFVNTRSGMLPTPRGLRIYMTDVAETVLLPALMRHLHEHSPAMRLETAQLPAAELAVRLETGDIDLAVGYPPQLLFGDRAPRRQRSGA